MELANLRRCLMNPLRAQDWRVWRVVRPSSGCLGTMTAHPEPCREALVHEALAKRVPSWKADRAGRFVYFEWAGTRIIQLETLEDWKT